MIKKILKIVLCISLCLSVVSCGSNIFEGFVEDDSADDLTAKIENASSTSDYEEIIEDADKLIASGSSSNAEKQDAYFIKAEATMGKAELSTLDLFADIASAADESDTSVLNLIDTDGKHDDLLAAAEAIASAESVNSTDDVDADQSLLKGVVNTLLVVDAIKSVFEVSSSGDLTQVDSGENYWDSLVTMVKPEGEDSDVLLSDYSSSAETGFADAASLSTEQQENVSETDDRIKESEDLYNTVKTGGTFNGVTYAGLVGDADPTGPELATIESQLDDIFAED
jgi:hypothetical protein